MIGLREDSEGGPPAPAPSRMRKLVAQIFMEGGLLEQGLGLEHRPQQETMARAVAAAMTGDDSLLAEAGTGVGKSLAYLIPGIIHACEQSRQLIVSTHTISLQEQLEQKDLPLCRKLFKSSEELKPFQAFRSAVLVGKGNYLCTTRLGMALANKTELFETAESAELQRISDWSRTTQTGLRHELSPPPDPDVWEHVNADSSACSRKNCNCNECFYQRAKARIQSSQVVIVNHSLLFALLNAGGAREKGGARGVLYPDDIVMLDEAHTVPEVATEHFGLRASNVGLDRLLKHLYNPKTRKGLLAGKGDIGHHQLVANALEAADAFFSFLSGTLLLQHGVVRVREAGAAENNLSEPLKNLSKALESIATKLQEGKEFDAIHEQQGRVDRYRSSIAQWLRVDDEGQVYWAERSGKAGRVITLRTAPLDIAPALRDALFERRVPVICTSATLAIGGDIEILRNRLGADAAKTSIVASPFDYEHNMRVYVAADIPLPSPATARLAIDELADWVRFCCLRTRGGSLVLFTSYTDMREVAARLQDDFMSAGRPFLLQGASHSRTVLTKAMRSHGNAILFGTESFWTGVDVPGDALAQVIITRLPFDPPTHPVQEARAEHIRDAGGNPFNELMLPDAVMKFRQGVGRLIRTTTDRGVITIMDARVLAKSYGMLFLSALPQPEVRRLNKENREEEFRPYS